MIPETNLSPDHFLAQVFDMGHEEHDIILQRVRESKVRVLSDTMYVTLLVWQSQQILLPPIISLNAD